MKNTIFILHSLSRLYSKFKFQLQKIMGWTASEKEMDDLINMFKEQTPNDINEFIRINFEYTPDVIDYSKHYLSFLYDECGDCDDFANLSINILIKLGYDCYLVSAFINETEGHAMCIAKKDEKIYGFGNWKLMNFNSFDFKDVAKDICFKHDPTKELFRAIKFDKDWNIIDFYQK